VGDVKQAIFTWREGDPRLFREILGRYNDAAPGTIAEEHLVASWRSGPAVVGMVNAVCGAGAALAELFPGAASAAWNREWRAHVSAVPQRGGQAAWLHAAEESERFALTVRLLHEIAPLERGLDCAVLTQTNAAAAALADYLRQEGGIPAVAESDLHVCTDNPLGAALLALVQAAAFPGDTLAQEHLKMTPLGAVLAREGASAPAALTTRVLGQIHADGFERTLAYWLERLEGELAPDDAFSRARGRQAVAAAALFDAAGSRDAGEFVAFMERHVVRGVETAGVVRVMTIHKSKGLGFDVVILPDLEGQRIDQRRAGLAVQRARDRTVEWVFDLPPKLFYAQDETLSAHVREAEAAAGYEAFSLLYVALTRAKRAMYAITKPPGNSASRNYPKWIAAALGEESIDVRVGAQTFSGGWSAGEGDWFKTIAPPAEAVPPAADDRAERAVAETARVPRRVSRRPSAERGGAVGAAQCFAPEGGRAAEFGTAVHALLADVEWGSDERAEARAQRWRERGADEAAVAEALACLHAPELAEVWRRPAHGDVWRERSFECVLENDWVTGVFDRVVVRRDAAGRALGATVYDFKTDALPDSAAAAEAAARHAAQLLLYRRIAAVLADVKAETVTSFALFTRVQRAVPI
jgi:ATP-dependent exoDNAse (exonuclease V) beta subunit